MLTISNEISIQSAQSTLFAALSTEKGLRGWYAHKIKGEVIEGAEFLASSAAKHESFGWKILELKPDTLIRWCCLSGPNDGSETTVTFKIYRVSDDKTCVDCEHAGHHDPGWTLAAWNATWAVWLEHLKNFVETEKQIRRWRESGFGYAL